MNATTNKIENRRPLTAIEQAAFAGIDDSANFPVFAVDLTVDGQEALLIADASGFEVHYQGDNGAPGCYASVKSSYPVSGTASYAARAARPLRIIEVLNQAGEQLSSGYLEQIGLEEIF